MRNRCLHYNCDREFCHTEKQTGKNIDHKQHTLVSLKSPVTFELMTLRGGQFCILRRLKYGLIIKVKLTSTDPCDVICRQLKSPKLCARIFQHLEGLDVETRVIC